MGKLVVDGNKVYTVDEACMRRKNLTFEQIQEMESCVMPVPDKKVCTNQTCRQRRMQQNRR